MSLCDSPITDRPSALKTGGGCISLVSSSESSPTPMLLNGKAPDEKPCECDKAESGESLRTIGRANACLPGLPLPYAWSGVGERVAILKRDEARRCSQMRGGRRSECEKSSLPIHRMLAQSRGRIDVVFLKSKVRGSEACERTCPRAMDERNDGCCYGKQRAHAALGNPLTCSALHTPSLRSPRFLLSS